MLALGIGISPIFEWLLGGGGISLDVLLLEDGFPFLLEDDSSYILLEA